MCYSKYWQTDDERMQREAKAKEAEAKRTETVRTMLANAEKQAHAEASTRRSALLCYEREACHCHRSILAERLGPRGYHIVDL